MIIKFNELSIIFFGPSLEFDAPNTSNKINGDMFQIQLCFVSAFRLRIINMSFTRKTSSYAWSKSIEVHSGVCMVTPVHFTHTHVSNSKHKRVSPIRTP